MAAEFALLYLAVPLAIAVVLPPVWMFPALFAFTALGLMLLSATPGFSWAHLSRGSVPAWIVLPFGIVTTLICLAVVAELRPNSEFYLFRENPRLLAMIFLLYPVLSALPQELIFRPLFFRRYGALLPGRWAGVVANAAVFALAHLMYWSWLVAAMTFAGGLVFAWAYERRGSFPLAVVLHALAGWAVFGVGLGVYFYSGNVVRPF